MLYGWGPLFARPVTRAVLLHKCHFLGRVSTWAHLSVSFTFFRGQQAESTGEVPEVASWTRKSICFGVRQTSIEILSPPQPALASWQVTLPISEKDVQGNHLTGLLGEGRV